LICSPTPTHADLIVAAAKAGKHIFCEKPIAHSLGQIDRALAAVEAAGVQLQIGSTGASMPTSPAFAKQSRRVKSACPA